MRPYGLASNREHIFISHAGDDKISILDKKNGALVKQFGSYGEKDGEFQFPYFLAYSNSELFVSDSNNSRIQVMSSSGEWKRTLKLGFEPWGLAVWNDSFFVADSTNNCLHVLDKQGKTLHKWGGRGIKPGEFIYPAGVCCGVDGTIYVADRENHRVQVLDQKGKWLRSIGQTATPGQELRKPWAVCVDEERVYVGEYEMSRVQVYSVQSGEYVTTIGKKGTGRGEFTSHVNGVMVVDGELYASDTIGKRIQIFKGKK